MPGPGTMLPYGNTMGQWLLSCTLSPTSVAATTTAEQTFTVAGLRQGDFIDCTKPSLQAGLAVCNARVSAKDTLAITFSNTSNAVITPTAAEVYAVMVTRPQNLNSSNQSVDTAIAT